MKRRRVHVKRVVPEPVVQVPNAERRKALSRAERRALKAKQCYLFEGGIG